MNTILIGIIICAFLIIMAFIISVRFKSVATFILYALGLSFYALFVYLLPASSWRLFAIIAFIIGTILITASTIILIERRKDKSKK